MAAVITTDVESNVSSKDVDPSVVENQVEQLHDPKDDSKAKNDESKPSGDNESKKKDDDGVDENGSSDKKDENAVENSGLENAVENADAEKDGDFVAPVTNNSNNEPGLKVAAVAAQKRPISNQEPQPESKKGRVIIVRQHKKRSERINSDDEDEDYDFGGPNPFGGMDEMGNLHEPGSPY